MKKITKHFLRISRNILLFLLSVLLLFTIVHQIITFVEKKQNPTIGQYVTVGDHQMSLYTIGNGPQTIVLLPGLGTTAPILDFMPLATELSKGNRVVIVEPFGYGFSDITSRERTLENEVEEIHTALHAAGIDAPYILMPHSLSGLHAIYYANTYADEVSAVIGIDCTLPKMVEYFEEETPAQIPLALGQLVNLGVMRLLTFLAPDNFISDNSDHIYSEENLALQRKLSNWKAQNKNVIDQNNHISDSIALTYDLSFREDLPVLLFTTDETGKKAREDGKTSVSFMETYITNPSLQKVIALPGSHYLHWSCTDEICSGVHDFLMHIR